MLFALRDAGFAGRMVGVDYAAASVELCRRLAGARGYGGGGEEKGKGRMVEFTAWDILRHRPLPGWFDAEGQGFDVVLDKGTFDAVCLSDELDARGRRVCEGYRARVEGLVRTGGLFVVTSCNWTEEELRGWFEGGTLEVCGRVEYPVFMFGGGTGQSVQSVCFRRTG